MLRVAGEKTVMQDVPREPRADWGPGDGGVDGGLFRFLEERRVPLEKQKNNACSDQRGARVAGQERQRGEDCGEREEAPSARFDERVEREER